MEEWAPFSYREFWDYPRAIVVEFDEALHFLDSPFDEAVDDYTNVYQIKVLTEIPDSKDWSGLRDGFQAIASIEIRRELFDETRRRQIRVDLIRSAIETSLHPN